RRGAGARDLPAGFRRGRRPAGRDRPHARHAGRAAPAMNPRRPGFREGAGRQLSDPSAKPEMSSQPMVRARWTAALVAAGLAFSAAPGGAQGGTSADPRVGLRAGWHDAGEAIRNLELVSHTDRPAGFFNPNNMGDFGVINGDLAFSGSTVFLGGYNGFQVWDVSNPARP